MRQSFCDQVERGRLTSAGRFSSERGDRFGAFELWPLHSRKPLRVIASDGADWEALGLPGPRWEHVSVSLPDRCPTWEEMAWVKSLFFEDEECVLEFHPPKSRYLNCHRFALHLWRPVGVEVPMPPLVTV